MGRVLAYAVLLSVIARCAVAVPDVRPTLTAAYGDYGHLINLQGLSPKPTSDPLNPRALFKRNPPSPTCGYISADIYEPFTCNNNLFCGLRTDLGVVGCCTSYTSPTGGQYTLTGCSFATVCYGSTDASKCTGSCASDTRVAYCTNSGYPYCMTYTYTDVGLSYFRCNVASGVVTNVAETYTTPGSVTVTTTLSSSSTSNSNVQGASVSGGSAAASIASASPTVSPTPSPTPVPVHHTPIGAIVGGVIGGLAVVVIGVILGIYFYRKGKKSDKPASGGLGGGAAAAATGAGVGAGAAAAGGAAYHQNHTADPAKAPEAYAGAVPVQYDDKHNHPQAPPQYGSPPMQHAEMASPTSTHAQTVSEADGRALSPHPQPSYPHSSHPHSAGVSELASPNMSAQAGPTSDWNRPFHELE